MWSTFRHQTNAEMLMLESQDETVLTLGIRDLEVLETAEADTRLIFLGLTKPYPTVN